MDNYASESPEAVYRRIMEAPPLVLASADLASLVALSVAARRPMVTSRDPRLRAGMRPGAEVLPAPGAPFPSAVLAGGEDLGAGPSAPGHELSDALHPGPKRRKVPTLTTLTASPSPSQPLPPRKRLRPADPGDDYDNAPYHFEPGPSEFALLPGQQASRPQSAVAGLQPIGVLTSPPPSPMPSISALALLPPPAPAPPPPTVPTMLSLIQGAVERLRATHGNYLGEFRSGKVQEGAVVAKATKIVGLVVVAAGGASLLFSGTTVLRGSAGGTTLQRFIQEGSPQWKECMRVPAPPREMAAKLVATEYGAFCSPQDCTVLVLVPESLVTGYEMLEGVLSGFKRCIDVKYYKTVGAPSAYLAKHKVDALLPPQQANDLMSTASVREILEEWEEDPEVLYLKRARPRKGRAGALSLSEPDVEQGDAGRYFTGSADPDASESSAEQQVQLTAALANFLSGPAGAAPLPGPIPTAIYWRETERNYQVKVSDISMGSYKNENTAARIRDIGLLVFGGAKASNKLCYSAAGYDGLVQLTKVMKQNDVVAVLRDYSKKLEAAGVDDASPRKWGHGSTTMRPSLQQDAPPGTARVKGAEAHAWDSVSDSESDPEVLRLKHARKRKRGPAGGLPTNEGGPEQNEDRLSTDPVDSEVNDGLESFQEQLAAAVETFFNSPAAAAPLPEGRVFGVTWHANNKKYSAAVNKDGQRTYAGLFKSKTVAARVYDLTALRVHGAETARLNYAASDYAELLPLLEPLDIEDVADVLKEYGRNLSAAEREGAAQQRRSRKRGWGGAAPGALQDTDSDSE